MNTVAQRKIPEEWTPQMWQAHVTEQEKRISTLEQKLERIEKGPRSHGAIEPRIGACLV